MKMIFSESSTWNSEFKVGGHNYVRLFLREQWNIFWFSYPFSPLHWLSRSSRPETGSRFASWRKGVQKEGQLHTYVPLTLLPYKDYPLLRSSWVGRNTIRFTLPRLRDLLHKNSFSRVDLVCINNPVMLPLLDQVKYDKSILRVTDDMASFTGNPDSIAELEEEAIKRVDVVFVTSSRLLERLQPLRSDIYYLPNGVQYDLFANYSGSLPDEYRQISSPRIVYLGAIDDWFDVHLVSKLAKYLCDFSFIFIGPVRTDIGLLSNLPNVYFLGPKTQEKVAAYLSFADVGIIPFEKSKLVDSISPIKMYEFLAAGLPVVATRWKELEKVNPPIRMAETASGFAEAVEEAFVGRNREVKERREFAKENSWEARFAYFKEIIGI